nr:PREDICTED: DNA-directed RNA polymerase I subunit RPA49-like [Bemisia tabaci]
MSQMNPSTCTIAGIEMGHHAACLPAMVEWETGVLKAEKAPDLVCSFRPNKIKSPSGRELFVQAEDKVFKAEENSATKNFHSFIAIRNTNTNKIRLFLAENLIAKKLNQQDQTVLGSESNISSRFRSMQDLKRAFGSKRSKRMAEQQERMRMNLNQLNDSINEAIMEKQVTVEEVNIHTAADLYKDILPPCNRNAEKVEDVYRLENLIDDSELDDYQELAESVQNASSEELTENCSRFFTDVLGLLPKPATDRQIKVLLYADTLVQLAELKPLTNKGMKQICPSARILQKIKDAYTHNSQKVLSRIMQDKIICHIFILLLLICNYKIFFSFLNNCSNIFRNKQSLLRIIGATPFLKNNDNVFMLRLPLPSLPTGAMKIRR